MREGRTLSAGLNRYSTVVRSTKTSAQNACVKISVCSKVHAKVREIFVVLISRFLFSRFLAVGHENRENLDLVKISRYTV